MDEDEQLALILQEQYDSEINGGGIEINDEISKFLPTYAELEKSFRESPAKKKTKEDSALSIIAPEWEGNSFNCDFNFKYTLTFEFDDSSQTWTQLQIYMLCLFNTTNNFFGTD